jgi:NAD(P)-dependent dehydrogenase (short-subunit alcohol dehydrogenase family)
MIGAIVTGAGRGIGAATAHRLAARGARVVLSSRSRNELDATAASIEKSHGAGSTRVVVADVAKRGDVERLRDESLAFLGGTIDLLVNNAGIAARAAVHEMDDVTWDGVIGTNLTGTFLCTRAVLPAMLSRGKGRIVNVSSISGTLGTARMSAYCASKWGVIGFTKAVAEETRDAGVQVMALLPGSVDTAMLVGSGYAPAMNADDVARAIEWLGLDAPAAMTGSAVEMFG